MNVLLIFPSILGEERYGKLSRGGSYLPPLGIGYIAAVLESRGHNVKIIDGSIEPLTKETLSTIIEKEKIDTVGITALTPSFYRALDCARIVKEINPNIITIFGGPHPTALPMDTIKEKVVDFVACGEGEYAMSELLDTIENKTSFSSIDGILYKENGNIKVNKSRKRIANLDELPFPARHLFKNELYKPSPLHYKRLPVATMVCGRGCIFNCTFCSASKVFGRHVILRSPQNIITEVEHLIDTYKIKELIIWDDTFTLNKEWATEVCDLLKPHNILWSLWARVNTVNRELIKKLADSGCWNISFGMESGDQKVLDTIKKGITLQQAKDAVKWCHEFGIEARTTWILGLPNDTWKTMMKTIQFAIDVNADYAQFHILSVYPNTELWTTWKQYGILETCDWRKYSSWEPTFIPNGLTKEQLEMAQKVAFKKFFIRPSYWLKLLKNINGLDDIKRYKNGALTLLDYFLSK